MENKDIAQLVIKTKDGNKKAFEKLYRYTYERARIIAVAILKNQDDAEDILQDSYIKALSSLDSLSEPDKFQTWFNRIVTNNCKNYLVKKKPELFSQYDITAAYNDFDKLLEEKASKHFTYDIENKELYKKVRDCINALPDDQRICVIMHYYNEMTVDEIAATLNISRNTVLSRLSYARKKLKKSMQKDKDEKLFGFMLFPLVQAAENELPESMPKFTATRAKTFKKILLSNEAKGVLHIGTAKTLALKFSLMSTVKKAALAIGAVAIVTASAAGVAEVAKRNSNNAPTPEPATTVADVASAPATEEATAEAVSGRMFVVTPDKNYIYCNSDNTLCRLDLKANKAEKLLDKNAECFVLIDNRLYFLSQGALNCFDTDKNTLLWSKELNSGYITYNNGLLSLNTKTGRICTLDNNAEVTASAVLNGSYFTVNENKIYYYDKSSNIAASDFSTNTNSKVLVDGSKNEGMRFAYQINDGKCIYPSFDSDVTGRLNIQDIETGSVHTEVLPVSFVDFCYNNNQIIYSTAKNGVFLYSNGKSTQIYGSDLYFVNTSDDYSIWYNAKDGKSLVYSHSEGGFVSALDFEVDDFEYYNGYMFYENSGGRYMKALDKED